MKIAYIKRPSSLLTDAMSLFLITVMLTGCKGRTADNMVPTGDTVEVVINTPEAEPSDSLPDALMNVEDLNASQL